MASSLATAASVASVAQIAPKSSTNVHLRRAHCYHSHSKLSFRLSHKPRLQFVSKSLQSSWKRSTVVKAQLNEVDSDGSSNAVATKSEVPNVEAEATEPSSDPSPAALASEESISEFITQVADLVKLVDSRDIVELQLKQLDCELLIRKKEALPQPPSPAPFMMMHSPPPPAMSPPGIQGVPPAAPPPSAPAPLAAAPASSPPAAKSAKSSFPPLKSPMAGTCYRSPAPGEPPFVKVGDKVQKGQVVCIIEAMKLMNEIEADQGGTVVEILAEDGKPVSVDTPLLVIEP